MTFDRDRIATADKGGLARKARTHGQHLDERNTDTQAVICVLVISENPITRHLITRTLANTSETRFEVYAIQSPEFSIEAYDRYRPKVVIAEKRFTQLNATWDIALRPLLERRPSVRVLVLDDRSLGGREPRSTIIDMLSHVTVPREAVQASRDLLSFVVKHIAER